jgi:energy-coupling factor transport system substrate-specific component
MSAAVALVTMLAVLGVIGLSVERRSGPREVALIAGLGAVAAAGRVLFVAVPSVTPVTVICLAVGARLGARAGAAVGAIAALVSNTFLGHGPWTPAQMALWAAVGASGALLGRAIDRRWIFVGAAALWGVVFGWTMNLWFLATFGPEVSLEAMLLTGARSLPFDLAGAAGNALIALTVGPVLLRLLSRAALRMRATVEVVEPAAPDSAGELSGPAHEPV